MLLLGYTKHGNLFILKSKFYFKSSLSAYFLIPLPVGQKYHQDQMSLAHQQQWQPQMLLTIRPVWNTGPGRSSSLTEPQNASDVEARMAQQARQKMLARLKMAKLFQQYRTQLISNKYDITVTSEPMSTEEKICLTVARKRKVVPLTVRNSGATPVCFTFWTSDLVKNIFTVRDCNGNIIKIIKQYTLEPGEDYQIKVHFHSHHAGFYEQLLVFEFETCQRYSDKFKIMRLLEVIHRTSSTEQLLPRAKKTVCHLQTVKWTPAQRLISSFTKPLLPLKPYMMPNDIKNFKKADGELQRPLMWKNYSRRFHLLLHLEELQQKTEIQKFNRDDVPMFRHKSRTDLFILQLVDGSNGSPLNLPGNQAVITPLDQPGDAKKDYKGWVHHVDPERVYLQFKEKFHRRFREGMRLRVKFAINRIPLRYQHRAVGLVYKHRMKEVLFPTGQRSPHRSFLPRLMELKSNPEQNSAIQHIVAGTAKPAPYLVFGPPGTGKTVTLVEAIKHIMKTQALCKILACAPSNGATDHLCEKILGIKIGKNDVYRLYSLSSPVTSIPPKIKLCCNLDKETETLMIPSKEKLMSYKIIVTTLITAGRLVAGGIPPGFYTYIFVDEAGQATETECIIPLAGLLKPQSCQVVLAGDPKQLGPVISSRMAEKHGLGVSLLERLMTDINLYKSHGKYGFNSRFVTKLLRNYRSHDAILKIPNELFYKGELQAYADKEKSSSYCKWEHLPKKGFPLIFHGVAGTDERDSNCPSVYNTAEVEVLMEYLKALIDHLHKKGVTKIKPREIGIIAPYRKQVEKIQNALKMDKDLQQENLENVLVGSVEQFQGKEFDVILVSAVRSSPKLTADKQHFTLGFVDNEKRFNVAMTRARSLLIVVGDPRVLKTDQMWNKFIHYCYTEGGYRGIRVSDEEEAEDTLTNIPSPNLW